MDERNSAHRFEIFVWSIPNKPFFEKSHIYCLNYHLKYTGCTSQSIYFRRKKNGLMGGIQPRYKLIFFYKNYGFFTEWSQRYEQKYSRMSHISDQVYLTIYMYMNRTVIASFQLKIQTVLIDTFFVCLFVLHLSFFGVCCHIFYHKYSDRGRKLQKQQPLQVNIV